MTLDSRMRQDRVGVLAYRNGCMQSLATYPACSCGAK